MKIKSSRLLLALSLLLISATMLGTASFAWFSMNTEVAVDGIEVEAYSDSLYLEISKEKNQNYDTSVSFAGEKQYLRLAKHGFVSAAYTLTETAISEDTYYDGQATYYEKVELADSNYKYVVATGLVAPETVEGLYKNPVFVKLGNNATFAEDGVYFEKTGSKYAQLADFTAGNSAAGYYTLSLVYTQINDTEAKAEDGVTYYTKSNGVYTTVDNVVAGTTEVNGYYTAAEIAAEDSDATYDSQADYYKKAGNDYYKVDTIFPGTNVKGYYTLATLAPQAINDLTNFTGTAFVQTATNEYSLLGEFTNENISNMLYFGRAYSDSITDGDVNDALNIITGDAVVNYRYMKSIYLRNANNTNDSRNLQAQFAVSGTNPLTSAVRVGLVVSDVTGGTPVYVNKVEYSKATGNTTYGTGTNIVNLLAGDEAQTLQVDVYVYYDGSDASAKNATEGVLALTGNEIDIKFTIDGVDYNVNP